VAVNGSKPQNDCHVQLVVTEPAGACVGLARTKYTVYIRYNWQGNHQTYGHNRCIFTVLANPMHVQWVHFVDNGSIWAATESRTRADVQ